MKKKRKIVKERWKGRASLKYLKKIADFIAFFISLHGPVNIFVFYYI